MSRLKPGGGHGSSAMTEMYKQYLREHKGWRSSHEGRKNKEDVEAWLKDSERSVYSQHAEAVKRSNDEDKINRVIKSPYSSEPRVVEEVVDMLVESRSNDEGLKRIFNTLNVFNPTLGNQLAAEHGYDIATHTFKGDTQS